MSVYDLIKPEVERSGAADGATPPFQAAAMADVLFRICDAFGVDFFDDLSKDQRNAIGEAVCDFANANWHWVGCVDSSCHFCAQMVVNGNAP